MKERLTLALAWYAFVHAALIAAALVLALVFEAAVVFEVIEVSEKDLGFFGSFLIGYFDIYSDIFGYDFDSVVFFGLSPAIWLGLWITTGKARFPPSKV